MRRKFICGNWKMNGTLEESGALIGGLVGLWDDAFKKVEIAICPPFTSIGLALDKLSGRGVQISVGAQNCHEATKGAFTGEISARMLAETGCTYVILGHSERRTLFNESNEQINLKIKSALSVGLHPILCIGETHDERELAQTYEVLLNQMTGCLRGVDESGMKMITIAYEPVWAIGTGRTATPEIAQDSHSYIRSEVQKLYGDSVAASVCILYGGSMNAANAAELLAAKDIDGGLIGGASLDAHAFCEILEAASKF
ncbi:MAG: triose-phosphate isomerase [Ignavibacteriota bacterium]